MSFVFRSFRVFDSEKLNLFFDEIIGQFGTDMLRYKRVMNVKGTDNKVVFQGAAVDGDRLGREIGRWSPGKQAGFHNGCCVYMAPKAC